MKALFRRAVLSPEGQVNYDIWALELDRAEARYRFRRCQPPFTARHPLSTPACRSS